MKRILHLLLVVLLLAVPAVSCVQPLEPWEKILPDPEPEPTPDPPAPDPPTPDPPTPPGPTPPPTPKPVTSPVSAAYSFDAQSFPLKRLELSSSGRYVAEVRIATKADDPVEVRSGSYTVSAAVVSLSDLGTMSIETLSGKATCSLTLNGKTYSGEGKVQSPPSASSSASELFKTWPITKTRISVSEGIKINADLAGCDLGELARLLRGVGVKIDDSLAGVKIESVEFTWGSMLLHCSNGHNYSAYCKYDNYAQDKTFQFSLSDFLSGFSGGDGTARVQFTGGLCVLTLEMSFSRGQKHYKGSITFVLK